MIDKIIATSLRNPFIVLLFTVVIIGASLWSVKNASLDAIPDLTPPQIIVTINHKGQSPQIIEDQIVYPLTNALMSIADTKTVRAFSSFENALVYVIFDEKVDIYWARDRISEILSQEQKNFPEGATVKLGPDATGIGWVYEYALTSKTQSLDELRTLQEYYYKYALLGVDGVSEVATVGGFEKSYEITVDQAKLLQYGLAMDDLVKKLKANNKDMGGRIILENGFEQIIQARGYAETIGDLENIAVTAFGKTPLLLKDIAEVRRVPAYRRGMADLNGQGEVVGGIVVARYGENAYKVIKKVKEKLASIAVPGVEVVPTYDRSDLIDKAVATLTDTLVEESVIVLLIVMLFLLHLRSSLVMIIVLPIIIGMTFLLMKLFGIDSNIMSLGGIAIAIGAMVDACIVLVENVHKQLHRHTPATSKERLQIVLNSSAQVGRPIFFALILIVVSFLPIFALEGQEGALFSPLAYTKTFAMLSGAVMAITLVPVLVFLLVRGRIKDERHNPVNRFFITAYTPVLKLSLRFRYLLIALALTAVAYGVWVYGKQKWEFMPPLNEQTFMYMPVTPYGIGIDQAKELTQKSDKLLKSFPEVETVFGKAGRADTATDPAPLSMIETIITLKPKSQWSEGQTYENLMMQMEQTLQIPGLTNSWTYPIRGRIDMLLTGIRTPLGIKLYGDDNRELEKISGAIERTLAAYKGTKSVFADRTNSGYYLNIDYDETSLARYGISKELINRYIRYAVGGASIMEFYEGIERYPVSVRFQEGQRGDINGLKEILIKTPYGYQPLREFARIYYETAPSILKSEKGKKVTFVYITPGQETSSQEYKQEAKKLLAGLPLPTGYYMEWAGESEYLESAMERLGYIIPLTLLITFVLIYLGLGSLSNALIVFFSLPFAALGGVLFVDWLDYNFSVAVIAGFLALIGVAAETAIVMLIYLDEAVQNRGRLTRESLKEAVFEGAVLRVRPKLMTVFATLGGMLPIMFGSGVGSEVMQRIAAPMIGGLLSSTILTLLIVPAVYYMIRKRGLA